MIEVIPKGFRVLVEQLDNRKIGNIELPDNATGNAINRYRVVALGEPGYLSNGAFVQINVEKGDEILFDVRGSVPCGDPALFGGRVLVLVGVDAILAVFKGEPAPTIVTSRVVPKQLAH